MTFLTCEPAPFLFWPNIFVPNGLRLWLSSTLDLSTSEYPVVFMSPSIEALLLIVPFVSASWVVAAYTLTL